MEKKTGVNTEMLTQKHEQRQTVRENMNGEGIN